MRAAHEGHGDEHSHKHQCGRNGGIGHLVEGIGGGGGGGFVFARLQLRQHRLDDHNGIIDDGTDGQHQGEQRDEVERIAQGPHDCEGANQRHDDGNRGDQRGLEVLKEQIHDEDHEEDGDDEGLNHIVDGGVKEVVGGFQLPEFQTGRQRL